MLCGAGHLLVWRPQQFELLQSAVFSFSFLYRRVFYILTINLFITDRVVCMATTAI